MNKVDICNAALSAAEARSLIEELTDPGEEARTCNIWYDLVLLHCLRAARWGFARAETDLEQANEYNDGSWRYKYTLPDNYVRAWFLTNYAAFTMAGDSAIFTNTDDFKLVYTKRVDNPDNWDAGFRMAMVYALAAHICGPLTGKRVLGNKLIGLANSIIVGARTDSANEGYQYTEVMPSWLAVRNIYDTSGMLADRPFVMEPGPLFGGIEP